MDDAITNQARRNEHKGLGKDRQTGWSGYKAYDGDSGSTQNLAAARAARLNVTVFPADLGMSDNNSNYIQFSTFTMRGGVGSSTSDISFEGPLGFVCLPIPNGVGATYEQGWDQQEVGKGASVAHMGARMGFGDGTFASSLKSLKQTGKSAAHSGKAVLGVVGKMIGMEAAAQRVSGQANFDNTYVTYTGPAFREFTYTFSLKPLSSTDSNTIQSIVQFFKVASSPRQLQGNLMRIYELPKLFGISYHSHGRPMDHLNKIAKCALANISVVYGGDRFSVFSENSAPVQVDLTLQFKEVQLLAQSDIRALPGQTGH